GCLPGSENDATVRQRSCNSGTQSSASAAAWFHLKAATSGPAVAARKAAAAAVNEPAVNAVRTLVLNNVSHQSNAMHASIVTSSTEAAMHVARNTTITACRRRIDLS